MQARPAENRGTPHSQRPETSETIGDPGGERLERLVPQRGAAGVPDKPPDPQYFFDVPCLPGGFVFGSFSHARSASRYGNGVTEMRIENGQQGVWTE